MSRLEKSAFPLACAALALALLGAYSNHFQNAFHFDDSHTIESNLYVRDLRNVPRFFADARTFSALPANQSYRPLLSTTLAIDHAFSGRSPVAYHVDSFLWLCAQCALMALLLGRLAGSRWAGLFGAALFGLHTAVAETVNYVIARGDILSALGATAGILLYAQGGRARRCHLYLAPMALGVLSKEQGAMAAPLLFLYVGLIEQRRSVAGLLRPRHFLEALRPALPAFLVCGALAGVALSQSAGYSAGAASRLWYAATQPIVAAHYFATFLVPLGLTADGDWTAVTSVADPRVAAGIAFLAAALAAAELASRNEGTRPAALGLLWFFVALLPTSSVFPLAEVMNDHRMYFPFVGLALAAASLAKLAAERCLPKARPVLAVAAVALLGAHAVGVHCRNLVWRSEETLWKAVTEASPGNGRGWMNYGLSLMARADYPRAERCFTEALRRVPNYGYAHTNLAILFGATGRPREAEQHFLQALVLMPRVPSLRFFFARWLDQVGRGPEAEVRLRQALSLSPADPASRELLMRLLARRGAWAELAAVARETLGFDSGNTTAGELLRQAEANLRAGAGP
ncbi:MAG TPA: tetratricopeptide repeat protein [Myxococcales bacterium]|jgi:tetratricopeptide (TPR) repeat protein